MRSRSPARPAVVVVAAALAVTCARPPRPPDRIVRFQSEVFAVRMTNGMRVLVAEDHATNLVEVGIRVHVGAASDPQGKAGLAHLVEHLMFQVRHEDRPIAADFQAIAVRSNAFTSWSSTHYATTARADQLGRVLQLEAARFDDACRTIPEETFEREREVVRNELRTSNSGVVGGRSDELYRLIYPEGHPYHRTVVGDDEQLSALTLDDACAFVEANYRPDRMTVVLSGDVDAREATALVVYHMKGLRGRGEAAPPPRFAPLPQTKQVVRHPTASDTPIVFVTWPLPPAFADDHAAATIAASLLAREIETRNESVAVATGAGGPRAPVAVIAVLLDEHEPDYEAAQRSVWKAARAMHRYRGGYDFDSLVNRRARVLLSEFDSLSRRVVGFADALQFAPDEHVFAHRLELLDSLTPERIAEVSQQYFREDNARVVVIEPDDDAGVDLDESELSYRGRSHEADDLEIPVDPAEAARALDVPIGPSRLASARRFELDNGLEVIALRTPAAPLLSVHVAFAGGSADDPPDKPGLALLAAKLLRYQSIAATGPDDTAVGTALRRFGTSVDVSVGPDATVFSIYSLSSHMDAMLAGISALVHDGVYSKRGLKRLRKRERDEAGDDAAEKTRAERRAEARLAHLRALYRGVYGASHPYARVAQRRRPDLGAITRKDLEAFRKRYYNADNGVLIVTGQYDPELMRAHVEHWFGDLRRGRAHTPRRPDAQPREAREVVSVAGDDDLPTTTIHVAYPLDRDRDREAERRVLTRMLDRRVARVRHVLGAAYAVGARRTANLGPGLVLLVASVDAARADEALPAILDEIEAMRAPDADLDADFARARRQVLASLVADETGARQTGNRILRLVLRGEPLSRNTELARRVENLTVDDVRAAIARDLAPARQYIGLHGPEDSLARARDAAGR